MAIPIVTQERLKERLHYDPESGLFTWVRSGKGIPARKKYAGCSNVCTRYVLVHIDGRTYGSHRLAWLYMTGEWPDQIDHINGDKKDNRFRNLRNCRVFENRQNIHRSSKRSLRYLGTSKHSNADTWRSSIMVQGESHHLGTFKTPEEAHIAYVTAKRKLHPFGQL